TGGLRSEMKLFGGPCHAAAARHMPKVIKLFVVEHPGSYQFLPNNHQSKSDFIEASCTLACKHPVNCLLRPLMLDVVVLFFLFGLLAGLVRSELKLPPALYDTLSLFLLLAIGLKGGVGLAQQSLLPLLPQLALVILLGVVQTLAGFALLRIKMNRIDAAATAAHYGSVSVATFAVGVNWLTE